MWFECGKPHKRCVTILKTSAASDSEKDEVCNLQSFAYNPVYKTCKNTPMQEMQANINKQSMKAMQVHTHLQAASLKLFPERKLRLLKINDINRDIAVSIKQDAIENSGGIKFDVAETWMLHADQTDKSFVCFNKQVDERVRNKVLCADSYPSLIVCYYTPETSQHLIGLSDDITSYRRAFLNAEDMLSFLQHYVLMVEGQPWVPDGSTVGPRFLGGNRGFPHKNRQPWVPATSFLFCVRWATRPNCQPLTLLHLESDGGPTASMPSAARPHCILPARNLETLTIF